MKICCDRCKKVMRKTPLTTEVIFDRKIFMSSHYYLCNDCVKKLREFLQC